MNISDFIPIYPYKTSDSFGKDIFKLKEFNELKYGSDSQMNLPKRWRHQELLARYSGPNTAYNVQLLYHTPGTGKTCGAIAITEDFIKKDLEAGIRPKKNLIIVPNEILVNQWIDEIAFRCGEQNYIPDNYFSDESGIYLTDRMKAGRLKSQVERYYTIRTIESFGNEIRKLKDKNIVERYDNMNVIIDEVHKLRDKEKQKDYYNDYYRFLHLISGKKILLTGTPMVDLANEIAGLMNLILDLDEQLPVGKNFDKKFLNNDSLINRDELVSKFKGKVSYIKAGGDYPKRKDIGETDWTRYIKIYKTDMSETQAKGYNLALKEAKDKGKNLDVITEQAINFVFEKDGKYLWGKQASDLLFKNNRLNPIYTTKIKDNLKEYSSKLYFIYELSKKNPNSPIFIFNELVSGTGGVLFQTAVLNSMGIKTRAIVGSGKSSENNRIIKIFNSPENRDGSKIKILIGSLTMSTGVSLITPKISITMSPHWNSTRTEQAIARAIRANSLSWLDPSKREIKVYQLAGTSPLIELKDNIDYRKFKTTAKKNIQTGLIDRFLKEISWDCALNYSRNYVSGVTGSRECNYGECNWKCEEFTPDISTYPWTYKVQEIQSDNWNIFYSEYFKTKLQEKIKKLFRKSSIIDISIFKENLNLVYDVLENIIKNNIKINNKWGLPCYLRITGTTLYLSENINNNNLSDAWYTLYPGVNEYTNLSEIVDRTYYKRDLKYIKEKGLSRETVSRLALNSQSKILETLYSLSLVKPDVENMLKDIFKDNFYIVNSTPVNSIQIKEYSLDYIDFTTGVGGELRCYSDNFWDFCDKRIKGDLSKKIKVDVDESIKDIRDNEYNAYIIKQKDGRIKIVDRKKEKEGVDIGKLKGIICNSEKKYNLVPFIVRLGISKDDKGFVYDDEKMRKTFNDIKEKREKEKKGKGEDLDITKIKDYYYFNKKGVKELCQTIEDFFTEKDLVVKL